MKHLPPTSSLSLSDSVSLAPTLSLSFIIAAFVFKALPAARARGHHVMVLVAALAVQGLVEQQRLEQRLEARTPDTAGTAGTAGTRCDGWQEGLSNAGEDSGHGP